MSIYNLYSTEQVSNFHTTAAPAVREQWELKDKILKCLLILFVTIPFYPTSVWAASIKVSTGDTFDIFCDVDGNTTDSEITAMAPKCLMMREGWGQGKASLAKTAPGSIVQWVIPYTNFGAMDGKLPVTWHDNWFYDTYVRNGHPEWALRATTLSGCTGRPIVLNSYPTQYLMDIGSFGSGSTLNLTKYVDRWLQVFLSIYSQYNYSGVFGDNTSIWAPSNWGALNSDGTVSPGVLPCNPRTGKTYTNSQWNADLLSALKRVRAILDPKNLFFDPNAAGSWWGHYFNDPTPSQLVNQVYIIQIENFVVNYGNTLLSFSSWKTQMAAVQDILKNKLATIHTKYCSYNLTDDMKFYRDASYLLVKYYDFMVRTIDTHGTTSSWWLTTDLGAPLGDMFVVSRTEVRARIFKKGQVLVNPHDTSTYTINLNGTYTNVQTGQKVTSVTLGPKRGVILTLP